jgi:isopentenyldiphosphate isomerase
VPTVVAEVFDVVDESDKVVGRATREEVHGNPALIHRVAHVIVLNGRGDIYLQRRAESKLVQPGKWDTSVGGHVDAGEDYEHAARREMAEELGISDADPAHAYTYLHRNAFESEMVSTYVVTWHGPVVPNPLEITKGRFWTLSEIHASDPQLFTPNLLEELARYREWKDGAAAP